VAFQAVEDCAEAVVRYACNGQDCTMTFYGVKVGGYDLTALEDLAGDMDAWAAVKFKPIVSSQVTYQGVAVRGLAFENDYEVIAQANAGAGGLAGQPLANALAFCMKRYSNLTGRSARGRVYFPVNASHVSTNEDLMLTTEANAILANFNTVRTYMILHDWNEVIVSRWHNKVKRAVGTYLLVQGYEYTDLELDTQRRRMANK